MTAWFSSQLLFLRCQQCPGALCITSRHSPATPRVRCNRDGHTTGWDAQKGNMLAPPGHTASKRSWTPVPHTSVTILCYHWSSLGPHRGQLLCLTDPRFPRGSLHSSCGPRPLPPPKLLSEPEGHLDPLPHLHQPELYRPPFSTRAWGIWQISQDCLFL